MSLFQNDYIQHHSKKAHLNKLYCLTVKVVITEPVLTVIVLHTTAGQGGFLFGVVLTVIALRTRHLWNKLMPDHQLPR